MAAHTVATTRWTDRHAALMWVLSLGIAYWRTLTTTAVFLCLLLAP